MRVSTDAEDRLLRAVRPIVAADRAKDDPVADALVRLWGAALISQDVLYQRMNGDLSTHSPLAPVVAMLDFETAVGEMVDRPDWANDPLFRERLGGTEPVLGCAMCKRGRAFLGLAFLTAQRFVGMTRLNIGRRREWSFQLDHITELRVEEHLLRACRLRCRTADGLLDPPPVVVNPLDAYRLVLRYSHLSALQSGERDEYLATLRTASEVTLEEGRLTDDEMSVLGARIAEMSSH